jgi:hypothetical protein
MQDNDYIWPGIAAATLALLFPIYWFGEVFASVDGIAEAVSRNIQTLGGSDLLFVVVALLTVYVYWSLKRILNDQFNFTKVDVLVYLMIGINLVFLATLSLDIWCSMVSEERFLEVESTLVTIAVAVGIGSLIVAGVIDILIAVFLLRHSALFSPIWKVFAVLTLVQGILEVSVFLHFAVLIVFPASLIVLMIAFVRKPESIEVV